MANSSISGLTASAANAAATDVLPVVQTTGVGPVKMTIQQVIGGILGSTSITGATETTSKPLLDLTQTWNAGAVTFTGLKLNVTDTASAASSLLMDLQVGGSSKFAVRKDNKFGIDSLAWIQQSNSAHIFLGQNASTVLGRVNSSGFMVPQASFIGFTDSTPDVLLTRRGAANLRLGAADAAAPVAQILSVQSVVAGTSNTAGANLTITGSQGTGTGAGGSIIFQVAPAGSSGTAQNALQNVFLLPGIAGEARIINASGGSGNLTIASTSNTNASVTFRFSADTLGSGGSVAGFAGRISGNFGFFDSSGVNLIVGAPSGSTDSIGIWGTDVRLARDAANTLALRNGTNAQTFRVYNTFTDASNYERLSIIATTGSSYTIATEAAGTGSGRSLVLNVPAGTSGLSFQTGGTTRWTVASSAGGGHLLAGADNTYDIGASGATRPRSVFVGTSLIVGDNSGTTGKLTIGIGQTQGLFFGNRGSFGAHADGVFTLRDNATTSFGRLQFGGATSSFPSLKRSTTTLQAVLADDTGFTNIQGKLTTETAYTAGAPTATGYIVLYDSTGTAYKVPAEAL